MAWDWSKKLGTAPQQSPVPVYIPAPHGAPQATTQQPVMSPQDVAAYNAAMQIVQRANQQFNQQVGEISDQEILNMAKTGRATVWDVLNRYRGDPRGAAKFDRDSVCPNCGDHEHYYSLTQKKDKRTGMSPSPICFTCGYNGVFEHQVPADVEG